MKKNKDGYTRARIIDDFGNIYYFWHEILFCIKNNITKDVYLKNNMELDHIKPVREGGDDSIENLRLCTHKDNMNNDRTIEHFSELRKGKPLSEQHKESISKSNIGKHHHSISDEQRKKISENMTGEKHPFFGKHHSEETKEKISKSRKGIYTGEKHPFYGKHHSEETKQKMRMSLKKKSVD